MATRNSYPPIEPGQVFGFWTVIEPAPPRKEGQKNWWCQCICGRKKIVDQMNLKLRKTLSCGCQKGSLTTKAKIVHGMCMTGRRTPEHYVWSRLYQRTHNPRYPKYCDYGGRGIKMCAGWKNSFQAFFADLGPRPSGKYPSRRATYSIDHKDNNGHYSCGKCEECIANGWPLNCRWATASEQSYNKRNNHTLTFQGTTLTVKQWAKTIGITYEAFYLRMKKWGICDRIFMPPSNKTS